MFWGIVLRNGLQYKLIVERPFHISRAVVPLLHNDQRTLCCPEKLNVGVYLTLKEQPIQICAMDHQQCQVELNLNFNEGEVIMFSMVSGYCGHDPEVHMTGYFIEDGVDRGVCESYSECLFRNRTSKTSARKSRSCLSNCTVSKRVGCGL